MVVGDKPYFMEVNTLPGNDCCEFYFLKAQLQKDTVTVKHWILLIEASLKVDRK